MILSFDEAFDLMDRLADDFPPAFYAALNGAVLLLPDANTNPEEPDLYTLGCYCHDQMGRRIELYYGSFLALASEEDWSYEDWREELRETLAHEFTHHLEGLAGERGLEIQDELQMEAYRAHKPAQAVPKPPRKRLLGRRNKPDA